MAGAKCAGPTKGMKKNMGGKKFVPFKKGAGKKPASMPKPGKSYMK